MITYIPAREWIPSRQRKPEECQEVLGVICFADDAPYIDIVQFDIRDQNWTTVNGLEVVRVTYWTELPNLPHRDRSRIHKKVVV